MFEESLIESARLSHRSGRGTSLPLSVALHVLIIGAAIGASSWFEDDAIEPPVPVIFYPPGSPPPPPRSSHRTDSVPRKPEKRAAPAFPPIAILKTSPSVTLENDDETVRDSDVLVQQADRVDTTGTEGGIDDGKNRQPGAGRHVETIRLGGGVEPPLLIARVEPAYPEAARKLHKEGMVILEAIITADGIVDDVRVLKSTDPLLDEAARRAVMQWRYRPATLNGRAVNVYLTVTVSFRLH